MSGKFTFLEDLPDEIEQQMRRGHEEYEAPHGIQCNYKRYSVLAQDDDGKVIGALVYYTVYAELYVDDIWVDKNHRHKGIGRALLSTLEEKYKGSKYNNTT